MCVRIAQATKEDRNFYQWTVGLSWHKMRTFLMKFIADKEVPVRITVGRRVQEHNARQQNYFIEDLGDGFRRHSRLTPGHTGPCILSNMYAEPRVC